jgi:hypothetical protein
MKLQKERNFEAVTRRFTAEPRNGSMGTKSVGLITGWPTFKHSCVTKTAHDFRIASILLY